MRSQWEKFGSMAALAAMVRWIPHNRMLADGLTKILSKANLMPLLKAMHHGKYRIVSEVDEETHRKQLKENGGDAHPLERHHDEAGS